MSSSTDVLAAGNTAWRDYVVDGVPSSGENEARKLEIRAFVASVAAALVGLDGAILDLVAGLVADGAIVVAVSGDLPAGSGDAVGVVRTGSDAGIWARVGGVWSRLDLTLAGEVAAQVVELAAALAALGALATLDLLPLAAIAPIHHRRLLGRAGPTDDPTGTGPVYELTPSEGRSVLELGALATLGEVALSNIAAAAQAALRDRATHTGTQAQSTIIGLVSALAALTAADTAEATARAAADATEATARAAADTAEALTRASADSLYAVLRARYLLSTAIVGVASPVSTGSAAASPGASALVWSTNSADVLPAGVVRKITVGVSALDGSTSGALLIPVMSGTGATATLKRLVSIPAPVTSGVKTYLAGVDFDAFTVDAGWVIGSVDNLWPNRSIWRTADSGYSVRYSYISAIPTVGNAYAATGTLSSQRINVNFTVDAVYDSAAADSALTSSIAAKPDVEFIKSSYTDLLKIWTSGSVLNASGASTTTPLGLVSPLIPAVPGLAFQATLMMAWPVHSGGQSGYAWAVFYDSARNVLGSAVVPERTANETILYTTAVAIAPANTAYVRLNGFGFGTSSGVDYAANYASCYIGVRNDAMGRTWYDASFGPLISGANKITVAGDSIASGLSWLIVSSVPGYVQSASNAVGGENVLDTAFRLGAIPIVVKAPVTLPADGTIWVDVPYVFGFRNTYTYDGTTGAYAFSGKKNTQFYDNAITKSRDFVIGVKSHRGTGTGGAADTDGHIYLRNATGSGVALSFNDDFEIAGINNGAGEIVPPTGIGVVMAGTNGGFAGINNANPSMSEGGSVDRLVDLFGRMAARFADEKMLAVGFYIGGFTTAALRDQYAAAMEQRFGRRFWDMRAWLLGTARNDLSVNLTSADYTNISAGTVPSIYLIDGTHPRTVVYRAAANRILERLRSLGWIRTFIPLTITLPASLTATVGAATIAVGATTPVTVTPGNSPTADSTVYLYATSNAAVATVSASGVVTGVATGTATITATCRFGGATATVDVTVA